LKTLISQKILVVVLVGLSVIACTKSDTPVPAPAPAPVFSDNMSAVINAVSFEGTRFNSTFVSDNLFLTVSDASQRTINISVKKNVAAGTYPVVSQYPTLTSAGAQFTELDTSASSSLILYAATSGSLTITRHNVSAREMEGTFNFESKEKSGVRTSSISQGKFTLEY